ncbi:MAG: hypothetical protein R6V50_00750 [Thermoplasmatota archaeon]
MGKNKDLVQIMLLVILGMFIPFFGSFMITHDWNFSKIVTTFGLFLLFFAIELALVFIYFSISNRLVKVKIKKINNQ